jgi:lysophospholipase L1-like esterase
MRHQRVITAFAFTLAVLCAAGEMPGQSNPQRSEFLRTKKDRSGLTWAVKEYRTAWGRMVSVGRLSAGGSFQESATFVASGEIVGADLDIDAGSNPWLIWAEYDDGVYAVRAACPGLSDSRIINAPYTASALSPSILAGTRDEIWAFWTGRDDGRDEIFGALFRNGAWSDPFKLNADDRYPHIRPAAAVDGKGRPRVVWSAYDGKEYKVYSAAWESARWRPEEKISGGPGFDHVPAVTFLGGAIPVVVWNRTSAGTSELWARVKFGMAWNKEVRLVEDMAGPVRELRLEPSGSDRFVVTWLSSREGGAPEARTFSLFDALVGLNNRISVQESASPALTSRDENQYLGFGDSITDADGAGYIPKLETLLAQRYGSAKVWNAGEGGEITAGGLARIDYVIAATNSKYIMILEGTNDIIDTGISADTTAFNLQQMAVRASAAGMKPLLSTLLPRNDDYGVSPLFKGKILYLNTRIRAITITLSITLVDMYQVFYEYPSGSGGWVSLLLPDGVHPNDVGFTLMAQTWLTSIKCLKAPKPPLSPALETRLDAAEDHKINAITWQANPLNASGFVMNYRVYRRLASQADSAFTLLASVTGATLRYEDANLDIPTKYAYRVTALSAPGDESEPAAAVTETKEYAFPPLNLALATRLDASETRKINTLSWQANPKNYAPGLKNYVMYRKLSGLADSAFVLYATAGPTALGFEDPDLDVLTKYTYRVTAVTQSTLESAPTASAIETATFVFPPSDVRLSSALNKLLFYEEKYNTVSFTPNPLNDGEIFAGYHVYRRRVEDDDTAFSLVANLGASALGYTDKRLSLKQKYAYAVSGVLRDGKESKWIIVTEI